MFEGPGEHKITDLEWCEARQWQDAAGNLLVHAAIDTPKGRIDKTCGFSRAKRGWISTSASIGKIGGAAACGSAISPCCRDAFDWETLTLVTHNGGKESETFALAGETVDHGAPVSFLVFVLPGAWDDGRVGGIGRCEKPHPHRNRPADGAADGAVAASPRGGEACSANWRSRHSNWTRRANPHLTKKGRGVSGLALKPSSQTQFVKHVLQGSLQKKGLSIHGAGRSQDHSARDTTRRPDLARIHPALARPQREIGAGHRRHGLVRQTFRQDGDREIQAAPGHHLQPRRTQAVRDAAAVPDGTVSFMRFFIGDVRDRDRLELACATSTM